MIKTCSVLNTTSFIGKKWTLLVFLELYKGNKWKRYNELFKSLNGITPKVLSQRLKEMIINDLIIKKVHIVNHKKITYYSLTPSGKDLIKITKEYKNWVLKWRTKDASWKKVCSSMDCENCEF